MDLPVKELRAFVAVCDAGTFTDAAIELGVSQAAVSRTIAALEARLGGRVLHRTWRVAQPTGLGADLLPRARRILGELDDLAQWAATRHHVLRLGYAWAAVGSHTPVLLRRWAAAHPDTELRLEKHNSPTAGLEEGAVDAAIVRIEIDSRRYESVVVGLERRLVVFASDDPAWARRRTIAMDEIADRTVLVDPRTGTTRPELWPAGHQPSHVVHTTDLDAWLDAIAAGVAVGTTAEATAAHHPRAGVTYRRIKDAPRIPVLLAWRRSDPPAGISELASLLTRLYAE